MRVWVLIRKTIRMMLLLWKGGGGGCQTPPHPQTDFAVEQRSDASPGGPEELRLPEREENFSM